MTETKPSEWAMKKVDGLFEKVDLAWTRYNMNLLNEIAQALDHERARSEKLKAALEKIDQQMTFAFKPQYSTLSDWVGYSLEASNSLIKIKSIISEFIKEIK